MTDSKSTCCGKPVSVFSGDEGTNHWICGACGKACDVVTDSKTAKNQAAGEIAHKFALAHGASLDWINALEQAILSYASDKDKQIAQLQLENGVKDEALRVCHEAIVITSAESRGNEKTDRELIDRAIAKSEAALSTSTKSSLMEKVHSLLNALKPFEQRIDGWRKHLKKGSITEPISKEWLAVESALTEVKKEMV